MPDLTTTQAAPQQAAPGQNPDVAWCLQDIRDRLPAYQRRLDYLEGRHRSVLQPGGTLSPLVASLLEDLADNMMDDAVEEPLSRLELTNWTEPADGGMADDDDPTPNAQARGQRAQDKWERNRGPARLPDLLRWMFALGDGFAIAETADPVEGDQNPLGSWFAIQDPRSMAVRYRTDRPDTIAVAAKVWQEGKGWRMNLYYPPSDDRQVLARIERYHTLGKSPDGGVPQARAFRRFITVSADGEPDDGTRAKWTRVPVFHFPCMATGRYGRSILTALIPLQDLLNKAVADLVAAMEDNALPARFGTGIQSKFDPITGEETPVYRRARKVAEMLTVASPTASFGQFDAADMTPFLAVILGWRLEIARKAFLAPSSVDPTVATPMSGLGLLVVDGRQVKRVKAVQRDTGWGLRELLAFLLTLDGVDTAPEDLDVEWANPTTRDELALWELLAVKRGLGVPDRQLLLEGGYDEGEVEKWLEDRDASTGGRVSEPGPGIASVTLPGMSGGLPVPVQPGGAAVPGTPRQ